MFDPSDEDSRNREAVRLALGIGWQVAIIYLGLTRKDGATPADNLDGPRVQTMPPVEMLTRTVLGRLRSLGIATKSSSPNESSSWSRPMNQLMEPDFINSDNARYVAQEMHLGLVESVASVGRHLRPAYELGRLLCETVLVATGSPRHQRPSIYRHLFDPLRLLPLAEWLGMLQPQLPAGVGQAVFASLQAWSRWVSTASDLELLHCDAELREQSRVWKDLLLGRTTLEDLSRTNHRSGRHGSAHGGSTSILRTPSISESLADISMTAAFANSQSENSTASGAHPLGTNWQAFVATILPDAPPVATDADAADLTLAKDNRNADRQARLTHKPKHAPRPVGPSSQLIGTVQLTVPNPEHQIAAEPEPQLEAVAFLDEETDESCDIAPDFIATVQGSEQLDLIPRTVKDEDSHLDTFQPTFTSAAAPRRHSRTRRRHRPKSRPWYGLVSMWILIVIALLAIALLIMRTFVAQPLEVRGGQVAPGVSAGDWVLVSRLNTTIHRGDLVMVQSGLVELVVAVPGDKVREAANRFYINGKLVTSTSISQATRSCGLGNDNGTNQSMSEHLAAKSYLMVTSCRHGSPLTVAVSTVSSKNIIGKVYAIVWKNTHPWFSWL